MQFLRRGATALLRSQRGGRAAPRAGGRGGPARPPLALPLHGGDRGPSGGHNHGSARPPRPPSATRASARGSGRGETLRGRREPADPGGRRPRRSRGRGRAHSARPAPFGSRRSTRAAAQATAPPAAAGAPSPPPSARSSLARRRRRCCGGRLALPLAAWSDRARPPRTLLRWRLSKAYRSTWDPRRAVMWSFIHKKGPTTLLGARRPRPFIGEWGVTSRIRDLSTGRYPVTP